MSIDETENKMTIASQIERYERKPFVVEAVQVTEDNMQEIKEWCEGVVVMASPHGDSEDFVRVPVARPMTDRQTKAFVGDWVLHVKDKGFKVFNNTAFKRTFTQSSS